MRTIITRLKERPRPIAILFVVLFTISLFFPIIGSIINREERIISVLGVLDVVIAVACFIVFLLLPFTVEQPGDMSLMKKIQK